MAKRTSMIKKTKHFKYTDDGHEWILPYMIMITSSTPNLEHNFNRLQKIHTDLTGHRVPFELNSNKDDIVDMRPKEYQLPRAYLKVRPPWEKD